MYQRVLCLLVLTSLLILLGHPDAQAIGVAESNRYMDKGTNVEPSLQRVAPASPEVFPAAQSPVIKSPAPVFPDYLQRSQIISTYEQEVHKSPDSFLLLRLLAAEYLKRFREVGDVED
ncbi:MAG: hypothetical protein ABI417_09850, partial [Coleofasciculaceae cyanobacterium]